MRPAEVLDAQADLLDRLADDRFARIMSAMTVNVHYEDDNPYRRAAQEQQNQEWIKSIMTRGAREGHTYTVSHDLSMLVEQAAQELDGTDQIDLRLPPSDAGLVNFDRPLPVIDARGVTMLAHWLMWVPSTLVYTDHKRGWQSDPTTGISLIWLNDLWREPDEVDTSIRESWTPERYEEYRRVSGRWATIGHDHVIAHQRVGPALIDPGDYVNASVLAQTGTKARRGTNQIRVAHALWLLFDQTLVATEEPAVERATRRRAEKRGMPGKITVMHLRRTAHSEREPGESDIEYAHRWIVKTYWRWQPVGPNHPRAVEVEPGVFKARVRVAGHVKGPEGAPFKITQKVYSLDR